MKILAIVILGVCFLYCVRCTTLADNDGNIINQENNMYKRYLELDKQVLKLVDKGIKIILPSFMEASEHMNISAKCMRNLFTLISGIRKLKYWAVSFLDANAKIPEGVLTGTLHTLGDFDLCLNTTVPKKDNTIDFRGQYCLVNYSPFLKKPKDPYNIDDGIIDFRKATINGSDVLHFIADHAHYFLIELGKIGICVPSGCSKADINQVLQYFGPKIMINASVHSCQVEENYNNLDTRRIVIICIFCLYGLLGLLGAFFEYFQNKSGNKPKSKLTKFILCFSITNNFQKLVNTQTATSSLSCLHGIRVLSVFFIILSHQHFILSLFPGTRNMIQARDYAKRYFTQALTNIMLTVDVFFLMGGMLHSYVRTSRERADKSSRNSSFLYYIQIILIRIWRLAPVYTVSILLVFLMTPRGPFVQIQKDLFVNTCIKNWWWNALFINNFFKYKDMCMVHSWYISVDMQLFIISLFAVGFLIRKPKKGIFVNVVLMFVGVILTITLCYITNAPPALIAYNPDQEYFDRYQFAYTMPFSHITPYFIGVLLGYYMATKKEIKIPKIYQFLGWITSLLCYISILFVTMKWSRGVPYTLLESAFFFTFSRIIYSLAAAWIIFCCCTGHGGIVNYILSLKLWVPLSRISYAVYLVSMVVQVFNTANSRTLFHFHEMNLIWQHMGDIVISCLLSLPVVVIFESPSIALQKLILEKQQETTTKSADGIDNEGYKRNGTSQFEIERNEKNDIARL